MMEVITCPECGKPNPVENVRCQWCGAILSTGTSHAQGSASEEAFDLPDWLKEAGDFSSRSAEEREELPDWLAELREQGESLISAEAPAEELFSLDEKRAETEEQSLSSAQESQGEPSSQPFIFPEDSASESALSDWLAQLRTPDSAAFSETVPPTMESPVEEGETPPEWLEALRGEAPITSSEQLEPAEPLPEIEIPHVPPFEIPASDEEKTIPLDETLAEAWLGSFEDTSMPPTQEEGPGVTEMPLISETESNAWLENLESLSLLPEEGETSITEAPSSTPEEAQEPEGPGEEQEFIPPFSDEEFIEWLNRLEVESQSTKESDLPHAPAFVEDLSEAPASEAQTAPPFIGEDLPEWLAEEEPAGESAETPAQMAQLPEWLGAMRPVEAVIPTSPVLEEDNHVETSGPLAGYQGVLPGEPEALRYSRPPAHAVRLSVSEKQRAYAALLQGLLSEEAERTGPAVTTTREKPGIGLRLAVTLLLFAVLIAGLLLNVPLTGLPNLYPSETVAFTTAIRELVTNAAPPRVFIGIDIEPGFSPELNQATMDVLSELMRANARIAVLSTQPAGAALAEAWIQNAANRVPDYASEDLVVNLGYLAGDISGLASLARHPALALQYTFAGERAWNTQPLIGVNSLADFNAFILITDSGDRARAWIEQVQSAIPERPFLVISSAQAGPYLLPYYQSGQVSGMVTGMAGSAVFSQLMHTSGGQTVLLWGAYQWGIMLVIILISFGVIYGLLQASPKPRHSKRKP